MLQRFPQQFFGTKHSAILKHKTRNYRTTWLIGWALSFTQITFLWIYRIWVPYLTTFGRNSAAL